jgi:hypothetical protein
MKMRTEIECLRIELNGVAEIAQLYKANTIAEGDATLPSSAIRRLTTLEADIREVLGKMEKFLSRA